jgi:hypothetical protein
MCSSVSFIPQVIKQQKREIETWRASYETQAFEWEGTLSRLIQTSVALYDVVAKCKAATAKALKKETAAKQAQKIAEKCERIVQNGRLIAEQMVHKCEGELDRLGGLLDKEKRVRASEMEYLGRMWPRGHMPPTLISASVEACLRRRRRRQLERATLRREWRHAREQSRASERKAWLRPADGVAEALWRHQGEGSDNEEQLSELPLPGAPQGTGGHPTREQEHKVCIFSG